MGSTLDPQPAYALGRGLKTLPLRVAQHNANALAVAVALEANPRIDRVYYPGLPSHPDHDIARRDVMARDLGQRRRRHDDDRQLAGDRLAQRRPEHAQAAQVLRELVVDTQEA